MTTRAQIEAAAMKVLHDDLFAIHAMTECVAEVSPDPLPGEHITVRNVRNICTLVNLYANDVAHYLRAFGHYFVAYDTPHPGYPDKCMECGLDLRDPIHKREGAKLEGDSAPGLAAQGPSPNRIA